MLVGTPSSELHPRGKEYPTPILVEYWLDFARRPAAWILPGACALDEAAPSVRAASRRQLDTNFSWPGWRWHRGDVGITVAPIRATEQLYPTRADDSHARTVYLTQDGDDVQP